MNKKEINSTMKAYVKLDRECRRIAKMYIDAQAGGTYYGNVTRISINSDSFDFWYTPSTSGMIHSRNLSFDYIINNGKGIKEKAEADEAKRLEELKKDICETCGHAPPIEIIASTPKGFGGAFGGAGF